MKCTDIDDQSGTLCSTGFLPGAWLVSPGGAAPCHESHRAAAACPWHCAGPSEATWHRKSWGSPGTDQQLGGVTMGNHKHLRVGSEHPWEETEPTEPEWCCSRCQLSGVSTVGLEDDQVVSVIHSNSAIQLTTCSAATLGKVSPQHLYLGMPLVRWDAQATIAIGYEDCQSQTGCLPDGGLKKVSYSP